MTQPQPIDARDGVSAELVDMFKRADRVVIGLKDRQTAVVLLAHGDNQQYVVLRAMVHVTHGAELRREQPLVIRDAQRDLLWRKAIDRLREGHVPMVEWALGWAQVCLQLYVGQPPEASRTTQYRAKLVPIPRMDALTGGLSGTRQTQFALGPTTMRRRLRVGEPYIVRASPS